VVVFKICTYSYFNMLIHNTTINQTRSLTECLILFYSTKWQNMPSWGFMISLSIIYFKKIVHIWNTRIFHNFSNSADLKFSAVFPSHASSPAMMQASLLTHSNFSKATAEHWLPRRKQTKQKKYFASFWIL